MTDNKDWIRLGKPPKPGSNIIKIDDSNFIVATKYKIDSYNTEKDSWETY